ncbi:unnamed protein product [Rangifer tarandus platyrhynchus]|uniref:Uncharacterized protein n=1 Tax=Rangifer tarandus platyrhynchus TaxID=3082113 RepID=A0AC59YVE5_RANTA
MIFDLLCSRWDLVPCPGIEPRPSVLRAQSFSRWTASEEHPFPNSCCLRRAALSSDVSCVALHFRTVVHNVSGSGVGFVEGSFSTDLGQGRDDSEMLAMGRGT